MPDLDPETPVSTPPKKRLVEADFEHDVFLLPPDEDPEDELDEGGGAPVRWVPGEGWVEDPWSVR